MPVLRPLVGTDKEEIVSVGRRIGTYEISILPDQDCCSLFVPKHPETRANLKKIEGVEEGLDVSEEFHRALETSEVLVQYPAYEAGPVSSVFEGIEGCGKSTQISRLSALLHDRSIPHRHHPGAGGHGCG